MDKILKRDEFVQLMEQKEYDELVAVNEGLIKNLFGIAKNLFKQDWGSIDSHGNPDLIKIYKELDDRLSGFTMMKLSKKGECNKIRQELVDFAYDWYDKKMNDAENAEADPKPAKSMKFKDDTLRENLENLEKKIKEIANGDTMMEKWANILKNDMKTVINRAILDDIKDEEAKKALEKQIQEDIKNPEKANKMMEEWQNEQLKEIQDERKKFISNVEATPMDDNILGDKAIQNICSEFKKIQDETNEKKRRELFKNDTTFGFKSIFTDDDYKNEAFKKTYDLLDSFYSELGAKNVIDKFKNTQGQSVQAMCIAINSFIKNCVYGGTDYGNEIDLMAKCAIISNLIASYNLPLNDAALEDPESKNAGNYFTDVVKVITDGKMRYKSGENKGKIIKIDNNFKKNSTTLLNKVIDEAKKLKEKAEKNYNDKLKSLNLDEKK